MTTYRTQPPKRIVSDDKARLRDQFLTAFRDTPTPCKTEPDLWHADATADRRLAAEACREHCPLLQVCDTYASAEPPERVGVWGGKDHGSAR